MSLRPRHVRTALGLATAIATLPLVGVVPASAAAAPDWPASRLPSGVNCPITSYTPYDSSSSGLNEYLFLDQQTPSVSDWTVNNQASVLALSPGSTLGTFRIKASQTCGGIGAVTSGVLVGSVRVSESFPFTREGTDPFRSVWAASVTLRPTDAGRYRLPTVNVTPRYSSFVLTDNWSLVGKTDFAGVPTTVTGPWSTKVFFVLRKTTQTLGASRTTVARGTKVRFRTTMRKAGASAYVVAAGSVVRFQTRVVGGRWVTRAALTTNAAGVAGFAFTPSRTFAWRWVHDGTRSGAFTAPSSSAVRTVKVT